MKRKVVAHVHQTPQAPSVKIVEPNGDVYGQEGVSSLVRPFLAAGAHTVVANLWTADDTFSLALMREFYRQLAAGVDKGEALRQAKLTMIHRLDRRPLRAFGAVSWSTATVLDESTDRAAQPTENGHGLFDRGQARGCSDEDALLRVEEIRRAEACGTTVTGPSSTKPTRTLPSARKERFIYLSS